MLRSGMFRALNRMRRRGLLPICRCRMSALKIPLALLCVATLSAQAAGASCGYTALDVKAPDAARISPYVGQGQRIEVQFDNESTDAQIETFPESNLKIRRRDSKAVCEVDGGIWVRSAVYASRSERVLAAKHFSGSNEFLGFYDTRTCAVKTQIDVSGRAWRLEAGGLRVGSQCAGNDLASCKTSTLRRWGAECVPRRTAKR